MYCITSVTLSQTDPSNGTCPWIPPKGLTTFMIPPSLPPPARAFWTLFSQDTVMKQLYAWLSDALGKHLLKHCSRPGDQQAGLRSQPFSSRQRTIAPSPFFFFFSFNKVFIPNPPCVRVSSRCYLSRVNKRKSLSKQTF